MFRQIQKVAILGVGLMVSSVGWADLSPYNQNFEGLDQTDPGALTNDGWRVFGNVFDSGGNFKFGYGPFGAPNGGSAFSAIVLDQGGPSQGAQQMSVYNDYNCCMPGEGHFNETDLVESNVFQEQVIAAGDVGSTWTFSADAKRGDIASPTTALMFIKTLDPASGFSLTNFITVETTSIPTDWNRFELSLDIDAGLVGQLLQIGFVSTASAFTSSGIFYDNIDFSSDADPDTDGDGVIDAVDNCTNVANAAQQDTDGDGHGNICDADFDGNCIITFPDLALMKAVFFTISPEYDLDSSGGAVNFLDLAIVKSLFFQTPGPSAPGALCN